MSGRRRILGTGTAAAAKRVERGKEEREVGGGREREGVGERKKGRGERWSREETKREGGMERERGCVG